MARRWSPRARSGPPSRRSPRPACPLGLTRLEDRTVPAAVWGQRGGSAAHTSFADVAVNPAGITPVWDRPSTQPANELWGQSAVAVDENRVYLTEPLGLFPEDGYVVQALDVATGGLVWERPLTASALVGVSEPSVSGGVVYVNQAGHSGVADGQPTLRALDAATGESVAAAEYAAQWGSNERPTVDGGLVVSWNGYFGGMGAWEPGTLAPRWAADGSIYDPPMAALDDTYVYAYGRSVALRSNGLYVGTITHPDGLIPALPAVSPSGRVLFDLNPPSVWVPQEYGVAAYDGDTHALLWTYKTPGPVAGKAVGNGVVAVATGKDLVLLDEATGAALRTWTAPDRLTAELVLTRTHVFVQSWKQAAGADAATVHAVDLATGAVGWTYTNTTRANYSGYTAMDLAFAGGRLYLAHDVFVAAFAVPGGNATPAAADRAVALPDDLEARFTLAGTDPETPAAGLTYTITGLPAAGAVRRAADGTPVAVGAVLPAGTELVYRLDLAVGVVSHALRFTVTDADGAVSPVGTVTLATSPNDVGVVRVGGTDGNDTLAVAPSGADLRFTRGRAVVAAVPAADVTRVVLAGRGGDDRLRLTGLAVPALLLGGPGADAVRVAGTAGADTFAEPATFLGVLVNGAAVAWAGAEAAAVDGAGGTDTLAGGPGANEWRVTGRGAGGLDGLAFAGFENLTGNAGADTFVLAGGGRVTGRIDGGAGGDVLSFAGAAAAVAVDLRPAVPKATRVGGFLGIESLAGGGGADTLTGPNAPTAWAVTGAGAGTAAGYTFAAFEHLTGGAAADVFTLAPGASVPGRLTAGTGVDTLDYGRWAAAVAVDLTAGAAAAVGGAATGFEVVLGGAGADALTGGAGNDVLVGNGGDDTLVGNGGRDVLVGGAGADVLLGGAGDDILVGGVSLWDADPPRLAAIRGEWVRTGTGNGFEARKARIADPGFAAPLTTGPGGTVADDGAADTLTGGANPDWFFLGLGDTPADLDP